MEKYKCRVKIIRICMLILLMAALLSGCGTSQEPLKTIEVSNLTDEASRDFLRELLKEAGVSSQRTDNFFGQVEMFNSSVSTEELAKGFETRDVTSIGYDPYVMQEEWMESNPDFEGYNCRITAFGLASEGIQADEKYMVRDDEVLFMDYLTLGKDPGALAGDSISKFHALYGSVETDAAKDVKIHVKNLQREWAERKLVFEKREKISLICVVFHDKPEENRDILFIGHAGTLLEKEGKLYFVEKIAFQEPYRMIPFENRTQLSDYLMEKYDVDMDQPTAVPFIMENDRLMKGYRSNPVKES